MIPYGRSPDSNVSRTYRCAIHGSSLGGPDVPCPICRKAVVDSCCDHEDAGPFTTECPICFETITLYPCKCTSDVQHLQEANKTLRALLDNETNARRALEKTLAASEPSPGRSEDDARRSRRATFGAEDYDRILSDAEHYGPEARICVQRTVAAWRSMDAAGEAVDLPDVL